MNHIHKYHRVNIARKGNPEYWVMRCTLHGCNSYTPMRTKLSAPLLIGKVSICNKCGEKFELNRRALTLAKPICNNCIRTPMKKELEKAEEFFENLEKGLL